MIRLVQIQNGVARQIALVDGAALRLAGGFESTYALGCAALERGLDPASIVRECLTGEALDYDPVYLGRSSWKLLPPIDHPSDPSRCLVTGTGLTHLGSARDRQSMHAAAEEEVTDSMKMFRWGVEGGRPGPAAIGTAPEWFYKGTGEILRAHGEPLPVPAYAEDGGEEAEIAGIYLIDPSGEPRRLGMAAGNEFSDHRFEKRNYLNLAGSKLRACSLGPELVIGGDFQSVPGTVTIERNGSSVWSKGICTGEAEMSHSLQNLEHHHFKFEGHRRPGDVHIHFFGAAALSFGEGVQLINGDVMAIRFEGFGRELRNPVAIERGPARLVEARPIL